MSNFFYFIKEALVNFKRNWSTSLGAVITIFLSLLVIGIFMVGGLVINNVVGSVEDKVAIQVFIADDAEQSDIDALSTYCNNLDAVSTVSFTSKEQALVDFQESMTSNPEIIEQLDGANPLPASIDIELADAQQVEDVADQILSNEIFLRICDEPDDPTSSIKYGQKTVERLFQLTNYVRYVMIALVALLVFVTFIFINNTIRLAILARRKEIAIMRLVGASNGFIRGPFIMEAIFQAVIGVALAIGVIEVIKATILPRVTSALSWLPVTLTSHEYLIIYLILLGAGLFIGVVGSLISMRRHLKV